MDGLGVQPNRKPVKCAKIVGETMGNFHPHGDMAIYPTLVGMGQWWGTRHLLIEGRGNFGSIDGVNVSWFTALDIKVIDAKDIVRALHTEGLVVVGNEVKGRSARAQGEEKKNAEEAKAEVEAEAKGTHSRAHQEDQKKTNVAVDVDVHVEVEDLAKKRLEAKRRDEEARKKAEQAFAERRRTVEAPEYVGRQIYDSAHSGNITRLSALLAEWNGNDIVNWDLPEAQGVTALYAASSRGFTDCVIALLKQPRIDVCKGPKGLLYGSKTPISVAANEEIKALLRKAMKELRVSMFARERDRLIELEREKDWEKHMAKAEKIQVHTHTHTHPHTHRTLRKLATHKHTHTHITHTSSTLTHTYT
jgi:hypothetical protein